MCAPNHLQRVSPVPTCVSLQPPPQLWRLNRTPDRIQLTLDHQFCARERGSALEFDSEQHTEFIGKGHFLNKDRFVLCATAGEALGSGCRLRPLTGRNCVLPEGNIHFWRRDQAHPVHVFRGLTNGTDKPVQVACNRASSDFMFATRSQDGTVRIWKTLAPPVMVRVDTSNLSTNASEEPGTQMFSDSPQTDTLPELVDGDATDLGQRIYTS